MDIGFAFSYPFKDEGWFKKLILIGVVGIIPIVGWFVVIGYMGQIIQRYLNDNPELLPELDFSVQLGLGFKIFVVALVYALPAIIIQLPGDILRSVVIPMVSKNGGDSGPIIMMISVFTMCCSGIVILYNIVIAFFLPIAIAKVASEETIGAGFKFGEIFGILKSNFVNYLIVVIVGGIAGGLINMVGLLVCVVGLILTIPYVVAIHGNFYAQAYKLAKAK